MTGASAADDDLVAIAFTPAPAGDSPNVKAASNKSAAQTFQRLIETSFASVRRWNPALRLVLVTTEAPQPAWGARLESLGAEVLLTEFSHRPPPGFYPVFNASLFSLDAMKALAAANPPAKRILLMDPDICCTQDLSSVFEAIPVDGFLAYDAELPSTEESQGLTGLQAAELHRQLDDGLRDSPRHLGGELYGFRAGAWDLCEKHAEAAWAFSQDLWRAGRPKFVTEEHVMNYALRQVPVNLANPYVRRIWTAPTYRTVRDSDVDLCLWHLPAEKNRGFARLHAPAFTPTSWFWSLDGTDWRRLAGNHFGLPRRKPTRWLKDSGGAAVRRGQHVGRRATARLRPW